MARLAVPRERAAFVARFGGIIEHSAWVAGRAFDAGLPGDVETPEGLHGALVAALRAGTANEKRGVIDAHPDLAGRLAAAKLLTPESTEEQASAGLDALTEDEKARFTALNDAYRARFGFVFIMAVRGRSKAEILAAFERRLKNDAAAEFAEALAQVERIAYLRLVALAEAGG
jgi:OHCU decarboxylase